MSKCFGNHQIYSRKREIDIKDTYLIINKSVTFIWEQLFTHTYYILLQPSQIRRSILHISFTVHINSYVL